MLELILLWTVSVLALGFVAILGALLVRQMFVSLGRLVFVESEDDLNVPTASAA